MVNIRVIKKFSQVEVANLSITDRVTIVAGDSATGKTHICSMLEERAGSAYEVQAKDSRGKRIRVHYCANRNALSEIMWDKAKDGSVAVVDEYVATELNLTENQELRNAMHKVCKYFLIFQRDDVIRYHVGVHAIKHVELRNKKYVFSTPLPLNDEYQLGNIGGGNA